MISLSRDKLISLALFLCTASLFGLTCFNGFVNIDDPQYVTLNAMVVNGLSKASTAWAWTTFYAANWHPLTWLSLQLDWQLFGAAAWGFHLTNALLHAASTVLLFWTLRIMTAQAWRSAIV